MNRPSGKAELLAGTDPTNTGSVFKAITLSPQSPGLVQVLWSAVVGKKYRVQFKTSPTDSTWHDLDGDVTATDTTGFKEDASVGASAERYYRVRLVE